MGATMQLLMLSALLRLGACGHCQFDGTGYDDGQYLEGTKACFQPRCMNEKWTYTGKIDLDCGKCFFGGEPLVYTFDELVMSGVPPVGSPNLISVDGVGEYVMTQQPGGTTVLGVTGHFTDDPATGGQCNGRHDFTNCIDGFIYYQENNAVKLQLNKGIIEVYWHKEYVNWVDSKWDETTIVDMYYGEAQLPDTGEARILVIEVPIVIGGGRDCTIVIGTKGLTVWLCKEGAYSVPGYPWSGIYAMKTLQSAPGGNSTSPLSGLCNVWTGDKHTFFNRDTTGGRKDWWQDGTSNNHNGGDGIRKLKTSSADDWKCPPGPY